MRYVVKEPTTPGAIWWEVCDTKNPTLSPIATFLKTIPNVKLHANYLCAYMNAHDLQQQIEALKNGKEND